MKGRFTRYECPNCEIQVDLKHFGSPHHSGIGCVNCDKEMELADMSLQ